MEGNLGSLTKAQKELLRRVRDGLSPARFPLVPDAVKELALLKQLKLLDVDLDGNVRLTDRGTACLDASSAEFSEFGGLEPIS